MTIKQTEIDILKSVVQRGENKNNIDPPKTAQQRVVQSTSIHQTYMYIINRH